LRLFLAQHLASFHPSCSTKQHRTDIFASCIFNTMADPGDQTARGMAPPPPRRGKASVLSKFSKAAVDEKRIEEIRDQTYEEQIIPSGRHLTDSVLYSEDLLTFDWQSLASQKNRANARLMFETYVALAFRSPFTLTNASY
jgi:hypothetical protein